MTTIAIIPARAGSRRIPRKNARPFHGKPIITYSIEAALASKLFEMVYVTTDDPMIGVVARQAGALPVLRSAALARDEVGTQEVTRSVLLYLPDVRYACCIYATAPLMDVEDLKRGFGWVAAGHDFAYSVGPDGEDAGQFYWGTRHAFMERHPLEIGKRVVIAANRVCDINTMEDFEKAERMYLALKEARDG